MTATLDLKTEKSHADPYGINSVQFSPDGKQIVSGGGSGTLKVWDAVNFRPHVESEWESFTKTVYEADDSDEEDETETWWRNKITGHEQSVKPFGGKRM